MEDLHVHRLFCAVGDSQRQVDHGNRHIRRDFRRRAVCVQLPIHGLRLQEGSPLSAQTSHNDLLRGDAADGDFQGQCHGHEDDSGQKL